MKTTKHNVVRGECPACGVRLEYDEAENEFTAFREESENQPPPIEIVEPKPDGPAPVAVPKSDAPAPIRGSILSRIKGGK